jgi:hypothetical protein
MQQLQWQHIQWNWRDWLQQLHTVLTECSCYSWVHSMPMQQRVPGDARHQLFVWQPDVYSVRWQHIYHKWHTNMYGLSYGINCTQ